MRSAKLKWVLVLLSVVLHGAHVSATIGHKLIGKSATLGKPVRIDFLSGDPYTDFAVYIDTVNGTYKARLWKGQMFSCVLVQDSAKYINPVPPDAEIEPGKWWSCMGYTDIGSNNNNLFAGKGKKYIGLKLNSGYFGWLQVNLDSDRTKIEIIDGCMSFTEGNTILAGQMFPTELNEEESGPAIRWFRNDKKVTVYLSDQASPVELVVVDISGRLISKSSVEELLDIDFSGFPTGIYVILVYSDRGIFRRRVAVE